MEYFRPILQIRILEIKKKRKANDLLDFKNIDIASALRYCSIYGDCWTITETNREPKEGFKQV